MRYRQSQNLIRSEKSSALINLALNQCMLVKNLFHRYTVLASIFLQTNPHLTGDVVNITMTAFTSQNIFPVSYLGGVNLEAMVNSSIPPDGHASQYATTVPVHWLVRILFTLSLFSCEVFLHVTHRSNPLLLLTSSRALETFTYLECDPDCQSSPGVLS